ncbi:class I SAM-dependent methyltransferase [Rhodovulum steppense]|uniref:Methyltransferase family protein n=1 Tax=Rhodovulum steppense TaxID=540251 RepID=A0A4R1YMI3_9RHOB|nr:class I SAM-dependent methyltransferase [Rhodovulum steppense]TCM78960.1 methyltransferase family protein [Rhodovulum steppense]
MDAPAKTIEEIIPCRLCGVDDAEVVFEKDQAQKARIVRCRRCGLMYASPRARLVDHEFYEQWEEPAGLLGGVTTDPGHRWRWRYEKESGQIRDFAATQRTLQRLYPNGGRMVEVGSGLGYLLRSFKDEGWDVLGIDPWRELPIHTREVHGIETIATTLEQAALPDRSVDVVVMLHVIEHVPDPIATLREIHRILKPGGHAVIETPRYDTFMFKVMRHRERSVKCDGHIYFFTFETLRRAYEKAGFAEVETRAVGRTLSMERFLWNVGTMSGRAGLRTALGNLSSALHLNRLRFTLNLRDMQRVVIRKEAI